jgi:protein phosphatase
VNSIERIAVISDIHGNIPALEAVLQDIQSREITRIYCLGDLIGKGPDSDLAVDIIREHCELVIMGNWEDFVTRPSEKASVQWHQSKLGEERLQYLTTLPFSHTFYMSGKKVRVLHASPESLYERIRARDPKEKRLRMFLNTDLTKSSNGESEPDVVIYGDLHKAFLQQLSGKTLFNVGSVGNPLDIPQAAYGIIEGEYGSQLPAPFSLQVVRVPYDIEQAVKLAIDARMPSLEPYIIELRTSVHRGKQKPTQ